MYDKTVRRRRAVLALLVVCSLIFLTAYFGESAGGGLHSVQRGVTGIVSPIQEGASRALKPFRDLFGWVGDTFSAKGELKDLRKSRDTWQQRAIAAETALAEGGQLKALEELDATLDLDAYKPVTARIISQSATVWYSLVKIDKGSSSGIAKDMPVLSSDGKTTAGSAAGTGLIGRVDDVGGSWATVRLITDQQFRAGARTLRSRTPGIVHTRAGNPDDLILDRTLRSDVVQLGETVVTAGTTSARDDLESPFAPNLPIGSVTRIEEAGTDAQVVHVKPFVDLRRINFAQVLTERVNGNRP